MLLARSMYEVPTFHSDAQTEVYLCKSPNLQINRETIFCKAHLILDLRYSSITIDQGGVLQGKRSITIIANELTLKGKIRADHVTIIYADSIKAHRSKINSRTFTVHHCYREMRFE